MKSLLIVLLLLVVNQCFSQAPVIAIQATPSSLVLPANSIQLKAIISLASGTIITNSGWSQPAGQNAIITDNSTFTTASNLINNSTYLFTYTVKDSKGQVGSTTISVPVSNSISPDMGSMIHDSIIAFSRTLDSVIVRNFTTSLSINDVDTLKVPNNTVGIFKIKSIVEHISSKDIGFVEKYIIIKNVNGVYSIPSIPMSNTIFTLSGQLNVLTDLWTVLIVNNLPILRLYVPTGQKTSWEFFYMKDFKSL